MTERLQKAAAKVIQLYANEVGSSPVLRELNSALWASGWKPEIKNITIHTKLKIGEPGFEFPPCDQCGSTSLRCGCD